MKSFNGIKTELPWAEMDNVKHLEYASKHILPKI